MRFYRGSIQSPICDDTEAVADNEAPRISQLTFVRVRIPIWCAVPKDDARGVLQGGHATTAGGAVIDVVAPAEAMWHDVLLIDRSELVRLMRR